MATSVVSSVVIARPVEEVFAFVTDARNNPQWQASSGLRRTEQIPEEPVGVGTRITEVWRFMGIESESVGEVTEYSPNRTYTRRSIRGGSPIKQGTLSFEVVEGGARVVAQLTVEAGGLFAIAEPLLASNIQRSFETGFAQLKALLERQAA
ncbi:MAG TPA: SRPBCC family protein [Ktedonobacterales bacterium]|nr:SRPBCC family protein [Ktedonobacterales bacterium]